MGDEIRRAGPGPGAAALDPADVCTLSPDGLSERLAFVRDEILEHAVSREPLANGIAWELTDVPGLRARLDRLVELERECCADIEFVHVEGARPGRRRLEVRGVDPAASLFARLTDGGVAAGSGAEVARAAGIGTALGAGICCALPLAGIALFGAAAAPLALLDQPVVIAGAVLASSAGVFVWRRRRDATRAQTRSCGCASQG